MILFFIILERILFGFTENLGLVLRDNLLAAGQLLKPLNKYLCLKDEKCIPCRDQQFAQVHVCSCTQLPMT